MCTCVTKFCMVVPNICGPSVWNLLRVPLLVPIILKQLLNIWKTYAPLLKTDLDSIMWGIIIYTHLQFQIFMLQRDETNISL
jgi:hypothetical protein